MKSQPGDVRRVEQLLPGARGQPRPGGRVDRPAHRAQQSRVVHDGRSDEVGAFQEVGVRQDRLDHRADAVARFEVDGLQRGERRLIGRRRDEVAPQLAHEERGVKRVRHAEPHGVDVVPVAGLPEHGLVAVVVPGGFEAEVLQAAAFGPVSRPSRQSASHFAHVVLGVRPAVGAEGEELHHLPREVLVRFAPVVVDAVQEHQHRRVHRHRQEQVVKAPEGVFAEELVLVEHLLLVVDLLVRVGEPVVPDERHPLHELLVGANHAVQPPAVVLTP